MIKNFNLVQFSTKWFCVLLLLCHLPLCAQEYSLSSPDGQTTVSVHVDKDISWSAEKYGKTVIPEARIDLSVDGKKLGDNAKVRRKKTSSKNEEVEVAVPLKNKVVKNNYNELQLLFKRGFSIEFRAFNEGVAYRFKTDKKGKVNIDNEELSIDFPEGTTSPFPFEKSTYSHYEQVFQPTKIDTIAKGRFGSLPILFQENNIDVLFSEADLYDYPNLFLESDGSGKMKAMFPKAVAETKPQPGKREDRNVIITKEHPYIARTDGSRTFPWRLFVMTNDDKELIEQNLVYVLSSPQVLKDASWVRPGKVAWDWYNANNIYGVDFKSGLNTETYKYYIDFASKYGLEYVILDEGWTKSTTDILEFNPDIDVQELINYGKEKNVGIILWCLWKPLDENMDEILKTYASWGAVGIKTDFMQRADQYMVNSYEQIAKTAAKYKLLVDFHGAYKPSGLRRAYPNVISYEGVHGNENNKWIDDVTPIHNTTLPFTRNAVGPMDYTPGAMHNAQKKNHAVVFDRPESLGTRAHQAAMYVVFQSALQMLCDTPSSYLEDKNTVEVISQVPTVWDHTKVLEAKVGEYVTIAREKDGNWYLGSMTDWNERDLKTELSFLPEGKSFEATIFKDGINANRYAEDYKVEHKTVTSKSNLDIHLAKGGGCLIIFKQK